MGFNVYISILTIMQRYPILWYRFSLGLVVQMLEYTSQSGLIRLFLFRGIWGKRKINMTRSISILKRKMNITIYNGNGQNRIKEMFFWCCFYIIYSLFYILYSIFNFLYLLKRTRMNIIKYIYRCFFWYIEYLPTVIRPTEC